MSWAVVWWSTCHSMWHLTCSVLPEMTWHLTSDTRPFSRAAKSTFASLLTMMDAFLYCGWSTSCKGFISGQGEPCKFSFQVMGRSCAPQKNLTWKLKICKKNQKKNPQKNNKKAKTTHIHVRDILQGTEKKRERLRHRNGGRGPQMCQGLERYKSLWCKLLQWWCCAESTEVTRKRYMRAYARARTHGGNGENIWICATCLKEVI